MDLYRSPMEKILQEAENDEVITNPKDRGKTFLRKLLYRFSYWSDRLKGSSPPPGKDGRR